MHDHKASEAKQKLSKLLTLAADRNEPVIIRRAGKKPAVLISLAEYAKVDETAHLLQHEANRAALLKALSQAGKAAPLLRSAKRAPRRK